MAKNLKTPETAPKSVPVPAEFQSVVDRSVSAIRPYAKPLAVGAVALVVAIVGVSIWEGIAAKKAGQATLELGKVLDTATARVEEGGIPDLEALAAGIEPPAARFKTFKERSEAATASVKVMDATYGGTNAAKPAALVAAGALYDAGKFDEALAAYRKLAEAHVSSEITALAREGIGYSLEAKALAQTDAAAKTAGLDEALKAYADIAADDKDPRYPVALYHQARLQALKGQKQAAVDLYKKVLEKNPNPYLSQEVEGRLSLLDAAPAPAPVPPVAPAPGK